VTIIEFENIEHRLLFLPEGSGAESADPASIGLSSRSLQTRKALWPKQ
jgi:hypothetical protein